MKDENSPAPCYWTRRSLWRLWRLAVFSAFIVHFWADLVDSSLLGHIPASTTEQKVNFTFDSRTYFLFLVRGLVSYQDEGKCQDGGSTVRRRNSGLPDTQITRKLLCNRFSCLKSKMRIKPGNRVALKICPGNNTLFYLFLQIDLFY